MSILSETDCVKTIGRAELNCATLRIAHDCHENISGMPRPAREAWSSGPGANHGGVARRAFVIDRNRQVSCAAGCGQHFCKSHAVWPARGFLQISKAD